MFAMGLTAINVAGESPRLSPSSVMVTAIMAKVLWLQSGAVGFDIGNRQNLSNPILGAA